MGKNFYFQRVFSGDAEVAYLALVDFIENKERYFAKQLYASMEVNYNTIKSSSKYLKIFNFSA